MGQITYGDTLARQVRLKKRSINLTIADLTAVATSQLIDVGAALPSNAVIMGANIFLTTVFASPGAGSLDITLGDDTNDDDSIIAAYDAYTGSANLGLWTTGDTIGVNAYGTPSGSQLQLTLTSTTDNLSAFTTGDAQIDVWYFEAVVPE